MALCRSCGSEVDESASFCTSCGQRMPSSNGATATITVTRPICSSCGAQVDLGSVFCTHCGQRMAQPAVIEETAPSPAQTEPAPMASVVPETPRTTASASAEPARAPMAEETAVAPPAPSVTTPEDAATQPAAAPQIAPPIYAAPTDYPPTQPDGGAFRVVVLILLLVIVAGGFGGWYFWGVETVIVCSPPDVRVFLDDKELTPSSYGRYVIPHLSRQSHLLKVQRQGFADTLQRLDFSLSSLHEWVNIKLVASRQLEPRR
jgi:uncharacterized Zn finger protein (UPF0148 family)